MLAEVYLFPIAAQNNLLQNLNDDLNDSHKLKYRSLDLPCSCHVERLHHKQAILTSVNSWIPQREVVHMESSQKPVEHSPDGM